MNVIQLDQQHLAAGGLRTLSSAKPREVSRTRPLRVAFIGAGNIAATHAEIVSARPNTELAAVVDSQLARAESFAKRWKISAAFKGLEELLGSTSVDALHILTPPDQHFSSLILALNHDGRVLVEKPLAANLKSVEHILSATPDRAFYVNHNFVFHPAFRQLIELRDSRRLGRLTNVAVTYAMPLRQLKSGQFSHWMFRQTANLLLEQAVHPLSQLIELAGQPRTTTAMAAASGAIPQLGLHTSLSASFDFGAHQGQLVFDLQASFPVWEVTAIFTDGVARADILRNVVTVSSQSHRIEAVDHALQGLSVARSLGRQSRRGVISYALSQLGLGGRSDGFFQSMKVSLDCFYSGTGTPFANGPGGGRLLVKLCEDIAAQLPQLKASKPSSPHVSTSVTSDVAIIGGAGFIGQHIAREFLRAGASVAILGRRIEYRPPELDDPRIRFIACDARNPAALSSALGATRTLVNTAGPELVGDWEAIGSGLKDQVAALGAAASANPHLRLIHLSSTAAMFLGKRGAKATGMAGPDPKAHLRADYAHAKATTDILLLSLHQEHGVPLCILRPAIVVGAGGTPYHSGVGLFVNEQHCLGWSRGTDPLPFVLARDVASAVVAAERSGNFGGQFYNLSGDVRLTAVEYLAALSEATERPITFHPQTTGFLYALEAGKGLIKWVGGKKLQLSSLRDLRSRAFLTDVDSSETKLSLGWKPEADRQAFLREAIDIHRPRPVHYP